MSNHLVPKAADRGSKKLISLVPDAWLQWVTQRPDKVSATYPTVGAQGIALLQLETTIIP